MKQQLDSLVSEMVEKGILFTDARREFEKRFIARVLQRHRGNVTKAAKHLRIHRTPSARRSRNTTSELQGLSLKSG